MGAGCGPALFLTRTSGSCCLRIRRSPSLALRRRPASHRWIGCSRRSRGATPCCITYDRGRLPVGRRCPAALAGRCGCGAARHLTGCFALLFRPCAAGFVQRFGQQKVFESGLRVETTIPLFADVLATDNVDHAVRNLDKRQGYRGPGGAPGSRRRRSSRRGQSSATPARCRKTRCTWAL